MPSALRVPWIPNSLLDLEEDNGFVGNMAEFFLTETNILTVDVDLEAYRRRVLPASQVNTWSDDEKGSFQDVLFSMRGKYIISGLGISTLSIGEFENDGDSWVVSESLFQIIQQWFGYLTGVSVVKKTVDGRPVVFVLSDCPAILDPDEADVDAMMLSDYLASFLSELQFFLYETWVMDYVSFGGVQHLDRTLHHLSPFVMSVSENCLYVSCPALCGNYCPILSASLASWRQAVTYTNGSWLPDPKRRLEEIVSQVPDSVIIRTPSDEVLSEYNNLSAVSLTVRCYPQVFFRVGNIGCLIPTGLLSHDRENLQYVLFAYPDVEFRQESFHSVSFYYGKRDGLGEKFYSYTHCSGQMPTILYGLSHTSQVVTSCPGSTIPNSVYGLRNRSSDGSFMCVSNDGIDLKALRGVMVRLNLKMRGVPMFRTRVGKTLIAATNLFGSLGFLDVGTYDMCLETDLPSCAAHHRGRAFSIKDNVTLLSPCGRLVPYDSPYCMCH